MPSPTVLDSPPAAPASALLEVRRLLEQATGAEIGLFTPNESIPAETCVRHCLTDEGKSACEGACALVRDVAEGRLRPANAVTATCRHGYHVAIHPGALSNATVVVLHRHSDEDETETPPTGFADRVAAVAALWERCERLASESEGLANEVLRSYEQLNIMFEVTQQIGRVQDTGRILLALLRRSAVALGCDWACCLSRCEGDLWCTTDETYERDTVIADLRERHAELLDRVAAERRVMAYNADTNSPEASPAAASLLVGPLENNEDAPDIVIFGRRADRPEFVAGDIMMTDALLNHGSHVLANARLAERLRTMSFEAIRAFVAAIDKKDHYTSGHSERVGLISRLVGEQLELSTTDLQDLEWSGLLHDIGKIGVSDGILRKPGKLTDEEFDEIRGHSRMGYEVLAPIQIFARVREAVLYHHETPDGTGYPEGLSGDAIPLFARIVHVADTFDALTSSRSYRDGFTLEKTCEIMRRDSGTKLDTDVVNAFFYTWEQFRREQPGRFAQMFGHIREEEAT